jgi:hypothetical protein
MTMNTATVYALTVHPLHDSEQVILRTEVVAGRAVAARRLAIKRARAEGVVPAQVELSATITAEGTLTPPKVGDKLTIVPVVQGP